MEKIDPTCKYGHGAMKRQNGLWALDQVKYSDGKSVDSGLDPTGQAYVVTLYRCQRCTYIEIHDEDAAV